MTIAQLFRACRPVGAFGLLLSLLTGCQDVVSINVPQGQPVLAVDGLITDQPGPYTVKLTKTAAYFDNQPLAPVAGAVVRLTDSQGGQEVLREQAPGTYVGNQLQGHIGNSYVLDIKAEGEEYQAATEIRRSQVIDSVGTVYREKSTFGADTTGFYMIYYAQEPVGKGDYIRFKRFKNGRLLNGPGQLTTSSDELVDGNYLRVEFGNPYLARGDRGTIEINSLTADYYHFLAEIRTQTDNRGLIAPSPANVRTNVKNVNPSSTKIAVGYFAGCAVRSTSVTIR
jgi:hypothetical protein